MFTHLSLFPCVILFCEHEMPTLEISKTKNNSYLVFIAGDDPDFRPLARLGLIEELWGIIPKFSDDSFRQLAGLKIRRISLTQPQSGPDWYKTLPQISGVEELALSSVDSKAVAYVAQCKTVTSLDFTRSEFCNDDMAMIATMTQLRRLDLSQSEFARLPKALSNLNALESLSLGDTGITDDDIDVLVSFKKLKLLDLAGTQLSETALLKLQTLPQLESLYLPSLKSSDAVVAAIQRLKLRRLTVSHVANLDLLAEIKTLEFLRLTREGHSKDDRKKLQTALPKTDIHWNLD